MLVLGGLILVAGLYLPAEDAVGKAIFIGAARSMPASGLGASIAPTGANFALRAMQGLI